MILPVRASESELPRLRAHRLARARGSESTPSATPRSSAIGASRAAAAGTRVFRRAPRSAPPARASRGRALRGSARGHPAEGGRRSPRSCLARPRAPRHDVSSCSGGRRARAGSEPCRPRPRCRHRRARGSAAQALRAAEPCPARWCARRARRGWGGRRGPRPPRAAPPPDRTSMSRTTSGPRVTIESGVPRPASSPMQARVSRNRPSAG